MANTKIPVELSSTPGIVDNSNATAVTIDTNENLGLASRLSVGTTTVGGGNTKLVLTGGNDNYLQMVDNAGNGGISIGNHAGGIMLFYSHTGALGSESYTQNLRLDTDGLKFGTDSAAANALNDYEEGTWTPTLPNGGTINTNYSSKYTKIGNVVYYYTYLLLSFVNNSSNFRISLPFNTSSVTNETYPVGAIGYSGSMNTQDFRPHVHRNADPAFIYFHEVDGTSGAVTNATMYAREPNQNGSVTALLISGWYYTD